MNERIKELAEQAEKYADKNFKGEPTWSEAYDSKFAELIVRECMDLFDDDPDSGTRYTGVSCRGMIKHYFGVEE